MASSVYSDKDYMLDAVIDSAYSSEAEDAPKEEPMAQPFNVEPDPEPELEPRPTIKRKRSMDLADAMYHEALHEEKSRVLAQLMRKKARGTTLSRNFTLADSIEDMNRELRVINRIRNLNSGVTKGKAVVLSAAWCIEGVSKKQSFIDLKLDGWFEHVVSEIDQYDPVLTEIYQEYFSEIKMNPILSLAVALGASAGAYSMGNRYAGGPQPSVDMNHDSYADILKQDDDLIRRSVDRANGKPAAKKAKTADAAPRFAFA
jgi:hypothetical protein